MSDVLSIERAALVRGGRLLFEGFDLKLAAGDGMHVTGPNGSGKSSLIRMVAGLLRPSAGRIERATMALCDEGLALDRELPLRRALAFWGEPKLSEALTAFDLDRLADVPVRLLSTGQAKRARLARVMASEAQLWLLDEPVSGLDHDGVARLDVAIAGHRASGGAVLAASHQALGGAWREVKL